MVSPRSVCYVCLNVTKYQVQPIIHMKICFHMPVLLLYILSSSSQLYPVEGLPWSILLSMAGLP